MKLLSTSHILTLFAINALASPVPSLTDTNSTLTARHTPGTDYYDGGFTIPVCVSTFDHSTGIQYSNLCTLTIGSVDILERAWVWLFDDECNLLHRDFPVTWDVLESGHYQIPPTGPVKSPVNVHSLKDTFFDNLQNAYFYVTMNGQITSWNEDQGFWNKRWAGGGQLTGFPSSGVQRLIFKCVV